MMTTTTGRVHIRWMIRRDLPEVLAIEARSYSDPWDEEKLLSWMRSRHTIGMIAERQDRVVAFMVYRLRKDRLELIKLAVHPDCRRRGVGRQMVAKMEGKLSRHRRTWIDATARESDLEACLFLRACGFLATGVDREAFEDTGEDAYQFAFTLREEP